MRSATRRKVGKDPAYLAFLRGLPCCVEHGPLLNWYGSSFVIDAAHIGPHAFSVKAPDRQAVAMCRWHHEKLHRVGPKAFWKMYEADPDAIIAKLNAQYERENGCSNDFDRPASG